MEKKKIRFFVGMIMTRPRCVRWSGGDSSESKATNRTSQGVRTAMPYERPCRPISLAPLIIVHVKENVVRVLLKFSQLAGPSQIKWQRDLAIKAFFVQIWRAFSATHGDRHAGTVSVKAERPSWLFSLSRSRHSVSLFSFSYHLFLYHLFLV